MAFIKGNNAQQKLSRVKIYLKITPQVIADAKGVTRSAIHKAIYRGILNPSNLISIAKYILD